MKTYANRLPPIAVILEAVGTIDMKDTMEEINQALHEGDCHETTLRLLHVPTEQLPKKIDHTIEPPWLRALHAAILKWRFENPTL